MSEPKVNPLDVIRARHLKGEPLLQFGDSFSFVELDAAMDTIIAEVKAAGAPMPIAIKQPD